MGCVFPENLQRIRRPAVLGPAGGRAVVGAVDDVGIRAAFQQQARAFDAVVLRCKVHGDGVDAVAFAAPVVAQVGVGAVVE